MKLLFALSIFLASTSAFAEGSDNGASRYEPNYNYSEGPAAQYGCRDGQRETVLEIDHSSGEAITRPVTYVCRAGRFVTSAAPAVRACRNGQVAIVLETDSSAGESVTHPVRFVCRAGKWARQ